MGQEEKGGGFLDIAFKVGGAALIAGVTWFANEWKNEKRLAEKDDTIAKLKLESEKFHEELSKAKERLQGDKEYFHLILALCAFGVAMALVDSDTIGEREKELLQDYISGATYSQLPQHMREKIDGIYEEQPNFDSALQYLVKVKPEARGLIGDFVAMMAHANGEPTKKQQAFIVAYTEESEKIQYRLEEQTILLKHQDKEVLALESKESEAIPAGMEQRYAMGGLK